MKQVYSESQAKKLGGGRNNLSDTAKILGKMKPELTTEFKIMEVPGDLYRVTHGRQGARLSSWVERRKGLKTRGSRWPGLLRFL